MSAGAGRGSAASAGHGPAALAHTRLSPGDQMRLVRLREIKAMLARNRKRGMREGLPIAKIADRADGPSAAMPPAPLERRGSRPAPVPMQPAVGRSLMRPVSPARAAEPALSAAVMRRILAFEITRARLRARRAGDGAALNRLATEDGLAAFGRQLRIHAYAQVQRRLNGVDARSRGHDRGSCAPPRATHAQTKPPRATHGPLPEARGMPARSARSSRSARSLASAPTVAPRSARAPAPLAAWSSRSLLRAGTQVSAPRDRDADGGRRTRAARVAHLAAL